MGTSAIMKYLKTMDRWEQLAFFPYIYGPIEYTLLLLILLVLGSESVGVAVLLPVVILSYYPFVQIFREKFAEDSYHFISSILMMLYSLFFPIVITGSGMTVSQFTAVYLMIVFPTFLGHAYSVIFQFTTNMANEQKALRIKEIDGSFTQN